MPHFKALSALLTASVLGQLLALLTLPLLTRFISTEQYGIFSMFVAVLALLSPLICLNLPQALLLTTSQRQRRFIGWLSMATALRLVVLLLCALVVIHLFWPALLSGALLLWYLLAPSLLLLALLQLQQQRLLAAKAFTVLAKAELLHSISLNIGKLLAALLLPLAWLLVVVTLGARLLQLGALQRYAPLSLWHSPLLLTRRAKLWRRWWRFKDFVWYQTPQQVLNALSQQGPLLLFAAFLGPAVAGFYLLAKTVLEAPATLVNKAVADMFYPFIADNKASGQPLLPLFIKVTALLAAVALLPFLTLLLFAEPLFVWLFGADWQTAGVIATGLALWFYLVFCNAPAGRVLVVCRKQKWALVLNILTTSLRFGGLYWLLADGAQLQPAITLLAVLGVGHNLCFIILACYSARAHDDSLTRDN